MNEYCICNYFLKYIFLQKELLISAKSATLQKSITDMLKAMLTKELAIRYTVTGQSRTDGAMLKFKGTTACKLVEGDKY